MQNRFNGRLFLKALTSFGLKTDIRIAWRPSWPCIFDSTAQLARRLPDPPNYGHTSMKLEAIDIFRGQGCVKCDAAHVLFFPNDCRELIDRVSEFEDNKLAARWQFAPLKLGTCRGNVR